MLKTFSKNILPLPPIILKEIGYKNGFVIEAGAGSPINGSNSHYFITKLNWKALLIEPQLDLFKTLSHYYYDNDRVICHYGGIWNNKVLKDFYVHHKAKGYSTFIKEWQPTIQTKLGNHNKNPIKIPCIPLDNILKKYNYIKKIDFLSIDCEGADFKVLKSLNLEKYNVKIISMESGMTEAAHYLGKYKFKRIITRNYPNNYFINKNFIHKIFKSI